MTTRRRSPLAHEDSITKARPRLGWLGRLGTLHGCLPHQTTAAPPLIPRIGYVALNAHPGGEVGGNSQTCRSSTSNALPTSPAIALSASSLLCGYGCVAARPFQSPIHAIVAVIVPSNGPQLPPALALASSPMVTTTASRFGCGYNVAAVARPWLTVVVIVDDAFFGKTVTLVGFVRVAFTPSPLFDKRHKKGSKE